MDNSNTIFPEKLVLQDGSEYVLAHDIKTMQELYNAVNLVKQINKKESPKKQKNIILAAYWTKKHLKVFGYGEGSGILSKVPEHFENDLDLATPIYVSHNLTVAYFLSDITEALYQIDPENLEEDEEESCRFNKGIEYQIYRKIK